MFDREAYAVAWETIERLYQEHHFFFSVHNTLGKGQTDGDYNRGAYRVVFWRAPVRPPPPAPAPEEKRCVGIGKTFPEAVAAGVKELKKHGYNEVAQCPNNSK